MRDLMHIKEIIRSSLYVVLYTICGGLVVKLYLDHQELRRLIAVEPQIVTPVAPVVEKLIHSPQQTWSGLQPMVKDTVVQIFSQKAQVDLLQPYKTPAQYQGTGSGFFINSDGEIVTNAHVVDQSTALWIQIPSLGKQQIDVDIVGVSPDRDLALLKVTDEGLQEIKQQLGEIRFLSLGNSDLVHRADEVMALGYPLGQQGLKSTTGVVSGREQNLIQISAPINPGNSGGPSLNLKGQVIGINTMYAPDAQNVGYIIPINELKIVLDDLRTHKLLRRPFLGVLFINASDVLTDYLGNPQPGGLFVVDVYKDSPLSKAGVKPRDMIYEINGHRLDVYGELLWNEDRISLVDYVAQLKLGQEVRLIIYRNGERKEIKFTFEQGSLLPIHKIYPGYEGMDYEIVAGMVVQPLTLTHLPLLVNASPSLTKYAEMKHQMEPALVITHVFPDSQAQRSRTLAPGCVLTEVNGMKVKSLDDLRSALFKSIETDRLTIETAEQFFIVVPFRKILEEERRLSRNYFYQITPGIQAVFEKLGT